MAYDVFEAYEKQVQETSAHESGDNQHANNDYLSLLEKRLETIEKMLAEQHATKSEPASTSAEEHKEELTEQESEGDGDGV